MGPSLRASSAGITGVVPSEGVSDRSAMLTSPGLQRWNRSVGDATSAGKTGTWSKENYGPGC